MSASDADQRRYEANDDPPAWWREAIDAMPWVPTKFEGTVLRYRKSGACPRCRDQDGIRASLEAEGWAGLGPQEDTDIFVSCQCTGDHGRPDDVHQGCGWAGYVAGPVTRGGD